MPPLAHAVDQAALHVLSQSLGGGFDVRHVFSLPLGFAYLMCWVENLEHRAADSPRLAQGNRTSNIAPFAQMSIQPAKFPSAPTAEKFSRNRLRKEFAN